MSGTDPFQLTGPPPPAISFTRLVFGVAFGIILSQIIIGAIALCCYFFYVKTVAEPEARERARIAKERFDELKSEIDRLQQPQNQ